MDFTVDDTPVKYDTLPESVKAAMEYLDTLQDGKLLTGDALSERINVTSGYVAANSKYFRNDYSILANHSGTRRRLYGNKRTVEAWQKMKKSAS